ncbi:zinc finger CCCH domain-containing protein 62-like [Quercus robur]|uniref:zinc finger CCCH domain-containing protein 62-like n=1 Tax=Quercus robur TaxID=38942 RepID=UPI002162C0F0|nr:zinc finger CCCH domain-containing protein 62-like [Quercus robur]
MAVSEHSKEYPFAEEEEEYSDSEGSYSDQDSDDSDKDPSYTILEKTSAKFSNLSIKNNKKSKARIVEDNDMDCEGDSSEVEVVVPELDEKDKKSYEEVQKIIEAGQLEKLKVDQCKVYLRKNGLRLTGNKDTLIQRIKEHLEILNGGGEKKYPASSFVLNCKGDACTGDVVMFEQNVYEMFNIASRSASGPPCGKRIVAGRIVKESYGAAKQQHTFTIEVLWSKGEKPLPPLHPLLIKGRNLYRLKTLRQRWEDEGKRQKVLMEKHSRGFVARSDRESRIQEKENKKMRIPKKETNRNQSQFNSISTAKSAIQPPQSDLLVNSRKPTFQPSQSGQNYNSEKSGFGPLKMDPSVNSGKPANSQQQFVAFLDSGKLGMRPQQLGSFTHLGRPTEQTRVALFSEPRKAATQPQQQTNTTKNDYHHQQPSQRFVESMHASNIERMYSGHQSYIQSNNYQAHSDKYPNTYGTRGLSDRTYNEQPLTSMNHFPPRSPPPLTSTNHFPPMSPPRRQGHMQHQLCRYYAQGRCHFGDKCKFLHERRREYGQRREDRWPCDQRNLRR